MTSDAALGEVIAWIQSQATFYPAVNNWQLVKSGYGGDKTFPNVTLEATSAEEHDILRGVYDPLSVDVRLQSIPNDEGAAQDAYTIADHEADANALYNILADRTAVEWIDGRGNIRCFDIRGSEGNLETDDDKRLTTIELRITCSQLP